MKKRTHRDKAGISSGTTEISPMGPQESSMDSTAKSQKPKPNPSSKTDRGHTLK